jgi:hypothetical protein
MPLRTGDTGALVSALAHASSPRVVMLWAMPASVPAATALLQRLVVAARTVPGELATLSCAVRPVEEALVTLRCALDKAERAGEDEAEAMVARGAGREEEGGDGGGGDGTTMDSLDGLEQRSRDNAAHVAATTTAAAVASALRRANTHDSATTSTPVKQTSVVSIGGCGWDGIPRDMGSLLITEIATWAKPGRAGDVAPIAAALAVGERIAAAVVPATAVEWANAGAVAAANALGKSLAGCLAQHAVAAIAAANAVAGDDTARDALAANTRTLGNETPVSASFSASAESLPLTVTVPLPTLMSDNGSGSNCTGGAGGAGAQTGGGLGALRRYLAATGHRTIPTVLGGAAGSGSAGHLHALLGSCGVGGGYTHLVLPPWIALEDATAAAERNRDALTFDDAAEALDWLCRALTVPHALHAAQRSAAAAAAGLVVGSVCGRLCRPALKPPLLGDPTVELNALWSLNSRLFRSSHIPLHTRISVSGVTAA